MKSSITAVAAALALLLGLGHDAIAADPYDIYVVAPLTGTNAFSGNAAKEGLTALQTVTNASGGIKGRPVNFVFLDSQSSPQTAVQLTNDIVAKKPPLFLGDLSVAGCNAMAPLVEKKGPVEFCLSPGYRPEKGGYIYTLGLPAIEQIKTVFRFLRESGLNRIALLVGTDATGRLAEPEFQTVAALPENHDAQLVTVEHFNPADVTIAAQVARIRAANAQAVIIWVNGSPFGTALRSLKDAGMQLPVVAVTGNLSYTELHSFADTLPNQLYFTWTAVPASDQPIPNGPLKAAQTAYAQTFKKIGVKPEYNQAASWDTGVVAIAALRAVGTDASPDAIRSYINALHGLAGVQAVFDFRSGDMRGIPTDAARILQWDKTKETWYVVSGPGGSKTLSERPQIGFIGTGNIGQPIIHSMLRAGFPVAVWNRTPARYADLVKAGASAATTPRELAAKSDILCAMLVEPAHLDALLDGPDGILAGIKAGSVFVDMATSPPRHAQWLEKQFAAKSVPVLDVPVQGGVKAAADATLTVMAGGDKAAYDRVLPLLQSIGKTIVYVGPAGSGQLTKLAHQVICAITLEALAESFALAKVFGTDQAAMHEVLSNGLASGPLLKTSAPAMFKPGFRATRPLWLYAKDRANLADTLKDTGLELPIAHAVFERMNALMEKGDSELDEMSLYSLFKT